jgi:Xaa-Pro dipeptidase
MKRRDFLNTSAIGAGGIFLSSCEGKPSPSEVLKSMTKDIVPISDAERANRVTKAQKLMGENNINALLLDAGTSMQYFTGISWWPSERPMVAVIPQKGSLSFICPGFEENRLREMVPKGTKVYPWQEDESPYLQIAKSIENSGYSFGKIGIEERLSFSFSMV